MHSDWQTVEIQGAFCESVLNFLTVVRPAGIPLGKDSFEEI